MNHRFLVVDTETSGLPKKWDVPYDRPGNWPYILQIAWAVYDSKGKLLKKENHYLKPSGFNITKSSYKIHRLSKEFLKHRGKDKLKIFKKLEADILKYNPLVIGHFIELDFHVLGAEFHRLNLANPLVKSPLFCTMKASAPYVKNPNFEFLKLNRFYKTLFNKRPEKLHDAAVDVQLTSEIFFYLLQHQEVTDEILAEQQKKLTTSIPVGDNALNKWILFSVILLIFAFLIWLINGN